MRLAANEIERSLQQASVDADNAGHRNVSSARLDEMAEAIRRADSMRRTPFGRAFIRGRKDGVDREVLTTGFTETAGNVTYRYVLMRFTETQEANRRRTRPTTLYRRFGDPKAPWLRHRPPGAPLLDDKDTKALDIRVLLPQSYHLLKVREDRLRR